MSGEPGWRARGRKGRKGRRERTREKGLAVRADPWYQHGDIEKRVKQREYEIK